jgi:CDGSH-type Zn-finger protein
VGLCHRRRGYTCSVDTRRSESPRKAEITVYPDGPMLVRGDVTVVLRDGAELERRRRVIALCRCGHSALNPLCDGTHKLVWRRGRQSDRRRRETDAKP